MGMTSWGQVEVWYMVMQLQPVVGQLACTGRGGVMRMIIIIIKRISRAPIYHTRWEHRMGGLMS